MRDIPIAHEVDVVVCGGSLGGVAAAVAAAEAGSRVFLASPRPYLGEDLCATLRLWLEDGEEPTQPLTNRLFASGSPTTPMRVKKTLAQALLEADVEFLLGCYVTEVLQGPDGTLAGVAMANRAGRQAVLAEVVIDATDRAWVARMAGAQCYPWPDEPVAFRRVVLGGEPTTDLESMREIPCSSAREEAGTGYHEYALNLRMAGGDFVSLARAEQEARDRTYRRGQLRASESLFCVPPDPIVGRRRQGEWGDLGALNLGDFVPASTDRLYVLSGCAAVPREVAGKLLRPDAYENLGRLVGEAAAHQATTLPPLSSARSTEGTNSTLWKVWNCSGAAVGRGATPVGGEVREVLGGLRSAGGGLGVVRLEARNLPVLGEYDVVVVGGGTSGACAAIGAARQGARVLVVEYLEGLGGTGTLGLIGRPYHGKSVGFSKEVPFPSDDFTVEDKMEWFRREVRKAGGEVWFGALGCGALVEASRVTGAIVATPQGRGVVRGKVVIDATGNADLAVAVGADSRYGGDESDVALQGSGLPRRPLANSYVNTDYLLVDESDMVDVWRALVGATAAMPEAAYDVGPLIQTRERRRVVGDHTLAYLDQVCERTYPDSIVFSGSDYDSHGYPSQAIFALLPHDEKSRAANHPAPGGSCFTPYRCLLPKGLDGILVTGLGISMERDASAMVRMQRDMHNQGYAAGVAAAMAAKAGIVPRALDVRALQRHLVEIGNLPAEVLSHTDSFPLPDEQVREAVTRLPEATNPKTAARPLAVILSHADAALPMLRDAHAGASDPDRLTYARVLGFLGDKHVAPELAAALDAITEWDARILQGIMAEYAHLPTPIDTLILALGGTHDESALAPILRKLETLDADVALSHHRSVALALEQLAQPAAAEPLARLLAKPGMRGHTMTELEPLHDKPMEKRRRLGALREITLARALFRCGDHDGLSRTILKEYTHDLRGLFARHATAVLSRASPAGRPSD